MVSVFLFFDIVQRYILNATIFSSWIWNIIITLLQTIDSSSLMIIMDTPSEPFPKSPVPRWHIGPKSKKYFKDTETDDDANLHYRVQVLGDKKKVELVRTS